MLPSNCLHTFPSALWLRRTCHPVLSLSRRQSTTETAQASTKVVWHSVMTSALNSLKPASPAPAVRSPEETWLDKSRAAFDEVKNHPPNDPYHGRTVNVESGDVARAFQSLDGILNRNKVRQQLRLTERHEKKGVKRNRLASERWRRVFAHEVRRNVQLVTKIRIRGA